MPGFYLLNTPKFTGKNVLHITTHTTNMQPDYHSRALAIPVLLYYIAPSPSGSEDGSGSQLVGLMGLVHLLAAESAPVLDRGLGPGWLT